VRTLSQFSSVGEFRSRKRIERVEWGWSESLGVDSLCLREFVQEGVNKSNYPILNPLF
jgi:hypothetical protein